MFYTTSRRLVVFFGIFLLIIASFLFYQRTTPRRLTFAYSPTTEITHKTVSPVGILIPSLSISLPIFQASVVNNVWETTDKGVSYLSSSPLPGEKGNSILYAHNWSNLFGNLSSIKPGAKITILDKNSNFKNFTVIYTSTVLPSDKSILAPSEDKRITLYTCTGFFDTKRFVVVATLIEKS